MFEEQPVFILDLDAYAEQKRREAEEVSDEDIENMLAILENFSKTETARMNIKVADDVQAGKTAKVSHHGRCDVGSPWAKGQAFDVLEDASNAGCQ